MLFRGNFVAVPCHVDEETEEGDYGGCLGMIRCNCGMDAVVLITSLVVSSVQCCCWWIKLAGDDDGDCFYLTSTLRPGSLH